MTDHLKKEAAYAEGFADGQFASRQRIKALTEQLEAARADAKKVVEALLLARVHVANNEQGWSVGRASARSDLKIINATLEEIEGEKK
jgi:hypothetical protein